MTDAPGNRIPVGQLVGFVLPFVGFAMLLAGITWYALESGPVAVLRTFPADAPPRDTRVWFARFGEQYFLLEAATPERSWYRDLLADPRAELLLEGERTSHTVFLLPNPSGHHMIRANFKNQYGWADVWVALFQDTSESVAVRLGPAAPAAQPKGPEGT